MSYGITLSVAPALAILQDIREKVAAIREPIFAAVHGRIHDDVASEVDKRFAPYPGEVVHPFVFATDKSRAFYFWALRTGRIPGQTYDSADGSYERQGTLAESWQVDEDVTANEAFMTVSNNAIDGKGDSYAQALYSADDPVLGHAITGWYLDPRDSDAIADVVTWDLLDVLQNSMREYQG